jgi:hypothetical protein
MGITITKIPNWFRYRLPSWGELLRVLQTCAFPAHIWLWMLFLYQLPSFLLSMRMGQIWGVFSYMQAYVLMETLLVFFGLALAAFFLPRSWYRDQFSAQSGWIAFILSLWAVLFHAYYENIKSLRSYINESTLTILSTIVVIAAMITLPILLRRWPRLSSVTVDWEDRLFVLVWLFLASDLLGVATIIIRNLISIWE